MIFLVTGCQSTSSHDQSASDTNQTKITYHDTKNKGIKEVKVLFKDNKKVQVIDTKVDVDNITEILNNAKPTSLLLDKEALKFCNLEITFILEDQSNEKYLGWIETDDLEVTLARSTNKQHADGLNIKGDEAKKLLDILNN